jgi:deazaflavin-dependent oxidoreductase (nitroreductase family)
VGQRPTGLTRWLFRAPIWLYRLGLGFLLGGRFLMLEHIGRTSGKWRYVVLEVVRHDRQADTYVVASAWGERSDWFRNVMQTPAVRVSSGLRRRRPALAVRLPQPVAARELGDYAARHPQAFAILTRFMLGEARDDDDAIAQALPVVALKVQQRDRA